MERDEDIDKVLEELAIWDVITHLEDKLQGLDELRDTQPLTNEQEEEYAEINQSINDLLDMVDDGDDD